MNQLRIIIRTIRCVLVMLQASQISHIKKIRKSCKLSLNDSIYTDQTPNNNFIKNSSAYRCPVTSTGGGPWEGPPRVDSIGCPVDHSPGPFDDCEPRPCSEEHNPTQPNINIGSQQTVRQDKSRQVKTRQDKKSTGKCWVIYWLCFDLFLFWAVVNLLKLD